MPGNQKIISALNALQELVKEDPNGGWDKAWKGGITPWDLSGVTPAVAQLVAEGSLPRGRILVPGCGSGYDVVAMATDGRQVVGLDLSPIAINRAKQLAEGKENVSFACENFFEFSPTGPKFDAIFDYTFFCAIHPSMREAWGEKMQQLLAPNGVLFTLMFPLSEHEGGPPFAVSQSVYEAALARHGFKCSFIPTTSIPVRADKEKLAKWMKSDEPPAPKI
eukprot:TRINITY_DN6099_c0_g2_i2.p1 TRINITY_DN6099_c0_g2~~TRINITY_DN6099_c0_g2_i2.p1  ORF type:complete len:221 (+),score=40.98 TRINITY_DN6099_c0_g2_i2:31-693(+)